MADFLPSYEPDQLRRQAFQHSKRAGRRVYLACIGGAAFGCLLGAFLAGAAGRSFHRHLGLSEADLVVLGFILGAAIGIQRGRVQALGLRFAAEKALCQVRIEEHLRRLVESRQPGPSTELPTVVLDTPELAPELAPELVSPQSQLSAAPSVEGKGSALPLKFPVTSCASCGGEIHRDALRCKHCWRLQPTHS